MSPKVSIVIPTYNSEKFIDRTIKSVLNQTFQNFELIIVDDCSVDNTRKMIREFQKQDDRIKLIALEKNSGAPAHPKNVGIKNAKGEYIAFLDHDDEWLPKKLEKQLELFKNSSDNLGFVGCNFLIIDDNRNKSREYCLPSWPREKFFERFLLGNISSSSGIMIKQKVLDRIGGFDEKLKFADDWDMWLRISKHFDFDFVSEILVKYHLHSTNVTSNVGIQKELKEFEYMFHKYQNDFKNYSNIYSIHLRKLGSKCCANGQIRNGQKCYVKSIKVYPLNLKSYLYLLLSLIGVRLFRLIYQFRESLNFR